MKKKVLIASGIIAVGLVVAVVLFNSGSGTAQIVEEPLAVEEVSQTEAYVPESFEWDEKASDGTTRFKIIENTYLYSEPRSISKTLEDAVVDKEFVIDADCYEKGTDISLDFVKVTSPSGTVGYIDMNNADILDIEDVAYEMEIADSIAQVEENRQEYVDSQPEEVKVELGVLVDDALSAYEIIDIDPVTKYAKSTVNVRSLPDTVDAAKILDKLAQNDVVIVNGRTVDQKWYRLQTIRDKEVVDTSFVSAKYLTDSKVTASKPTSNGGTSTGGSVATQPATPATPTYTTPDAVPAQSAADYAARHGVTVISVDPNAGSGTPNHDVEWE